MASDKRKMIGLLRLEMENIRWRGFGTFFRDGFLCLNAGESVPTHDCGDCELIAFVPPERRQEATPCYHIPLDAPGHTVASLTRDGRRHECQQAILAWMQQTVERLEKELAAERPESDKRKSKSRKKSHPSAR